APHINMISPERASAGLPVTITGNGFNGNAVLHVYQNGAVYGTVAVVRIIDPTEVTFVVPDWIGPYCHLNAYCITIAKELPSGTYSVAIETEDGVSNQVA